MPGHQNLGGVDSTQNQGNVLGDRPCVRQSRLYREHVGGNDMKGLLGQDTLKWKTDQQEGAYAGARVHDHKDGQEVVGKASRPQGGEVPPAPVATEAQDEYKGRRGAGAANRTTYNFMTGQ